MDAWSCQLREYGQNNSTTNKPDRQSQVSGQSKRNVEKVSSQSGPRDLTMKQDKDDGDKNLEKCVALLAKMLDKEGKFAKPVQKTCKSSKVTFGKVNRKQPKLAAKSSKVIAKTSSLKVNTKPTTKGPEKTSNKKTQPPERPNQGTPGISSKENSPESKQSVPCPPQTSDGFHVEDNLALEVLYGRKFDTASHPLVPFQPSIVTSVPYNQRLACSTPVDDNPPKPTLSSAAGVPCMPPAPTQDSSYRLTYSTNQPLNSSDLVKLVTPEEPVDLGPKLKSGLIEFQAHPVIKSHKTGIAVPSWGCGPTGDFSLYSNPTVSGQTTSELSRQGLGTGHSTLSCHNGTTYSGGPNLKTCVSTVEDPVSVSCGPNVVSCGSVAPGVGYSSTGADAAQTGCRVALEHMVTRDTQWQTTQCSAADAVVQATSDVCPSDDDGDEDDTLHQHLPESHEPYPQNANPPPIQPFTTAKLQTGHVQTANKKVQFTTKAKRKTKPIITDVSEKQVISTGTQSEGASPTCDAILDAHTTAGPVKQRVKSSKQKPKLKCPKTRAVHRLTKELQSKLGDGGNSHVQQLLGQLVSATESVPGAKEGKLEIDLALQPLRSENSQLKRQLRIANQQLRDKEQEITSAHKPDSNFQVVHLEMVKYSLEKALKEEKTAKERQKERLNLLQTEVDKLLAEKQQLLDIINTKDSEALLSTSELVNEKRRLVVECDRLTEQLHRSDGQMDGMKAEQVKMRLGMKQKEQEVAKLQQLVGNLQLSMTRLLHDLQSSQPDPIQSIGHLNDGLQKIETTLHEDFSLRDPSISGFSSYPSTTHASSSPETTDCQALQQKPLTDSGVSTACRALVFEKNPHPQQRLIQMTEKPVMTSDDEGFSVEQDKELNKSPAQTTDVTLSEYNMPLGASPFGRKFGTGSPPERENGGSGFTVKDLLTPLADRMQEFRRMTSGGVESSGGTEKRVFAPRSDMKKSVPDCDEPLSDIFSIHSDNGEGDTTLTEDPKPDPIPQRHSLPEKLADHSRFSFTDYFEKYPKVSTDKGDEFTEEKLDDAANRVAISTSDILSTPSDPSWGTRSLPGKSITSSRSRPSIQDSLYKGTQLDTSISTINDNQSVASSTSVLSTCSITSVDDKMFKEGLANLDANISRMQNQLRLAAL